MLSSCDLVAFVTSADRDRARGFYGGTLGLRLREDAPYALVFDANGTTLRVAIAQQVAAAPYTVLGWTVPDIAAVVDGLAAAGITLERFDGIDQDERGVWRTPSGDQVAWFKDPDGNVLSATELKSAH